MLSLKNISKNYSRRNILNDVSIDFQANIVTALVGPNGAGKTTLLKVIIGLEKSKGEVYFNANLNTIKDKADKNDHVLLSKLPTHKRISLGLGYMSQNSRQLQTSP